MLLITILRGDTMEIKQKFLSGERAMFGTHDCDIYDTVFDDGESPLKHSSDIRLNGSMFKWKYPLWYSKNIDMKNCTFFATARAGIWYTDNISVKDTMIEAPKTFRRANGISLDNVMFSDAAETLWNCSGIDMNRVSAKGDYFAMNSCDITADDFKLVGNYCFDGSKNVTLSGAVMLSKDSFWNCENVTVKDSFISGEYLGWNSKNLVFENCTIESLQGMCYIDRLVMKNCKLINTTLAFEYSTVDADIASGIDSVFNPSGGVIRADYIGELTIDKDRVNPSRTKIICKK